MNNTYTLSQIKSNVFMLLDEYSKNGEKSYEKDGYALDVAKRMPIYLRVTSKIVFNEHPVERIARVKLLTPKIIKEIHHKDLEQNDTIDFKLDKNHRCIAYINACGAISFHTNKDPHSMDSGVVLKLVNETTTYNEIYSYVSEIYAEDVCTLFARSACHLKDFVLFDYDSVHNLLSPWQIPPYGKCCASLPNDFSEVLFIQSNDSQPMHKELFTFDSKALTIMADADNAGEYTIGYSASVPSFDSLKEDSDEIELSHKHFELIVCKLAMLLCDVGSTDTYIKLSHLYNELSEAYKEDNTQTQIKRNTFYTAQKTALQGNVSKGVWNG